MKREKGTDEYERGYAAAIEDVRKLSGRFQEASFGAGNTREQEYLHYFTKNMLEELK